MRKFSLGLIVGLFIGFFVAIPNTAIADSVISLFVNDQQIDCKVPPQIIDGVLMVPVYDFAYQMGFAAIRTVDDNGNVDAVYIKKVVPINNTNYAKEAHDWSDKLLPVCNDIIKFMASDNKDASYGISKIDELDGLVTDFAKWSCPNEYKDFKNLLLETSDNFIDAAKSQVVYLNTSGTSDQIKVLLTRNEQISSAKRSMAKLLAEVNNLKGKGLL